MENGAIQEWQIWVSSHTKKSSSDQARLNLEKAWIAKDEDYNAWLQIYLPHWYISITAVATQGLEERSKWVTKYKLQYWRWGANVVFYKDLQQSGPFKVMN